MGDIIWSATRYSKAKKCLLYYYYDYLHKPSIRFPLSGSLAAGLFIHRCAQNFDSPKGRPFFKTDESYANAMRGRFLNATKSDDSAFQGKPIQWAWKGEKYAKANSVKRMAYNLCLRNRRLVESGRELLIRESPSEVYEINGIKLRGNFDEVWKGLSLVDLKSGTVRQQYVDANPQLLIYGMLFCAALKQDDEFALMNFSSNNSDRDRRIVDEIKEGDLLVHPEIKLSFYSFEKDEEFFMPSEGRGSKARILLDDLARLEELISGLKERVLAGESFSNKLTGFGCNYCDASKEGICCTEEPLRYLGGVLGPKPEQPTLFGPLEIKLVPSGSGILLPSIKLKRELERRKVEQLKLKKGRKK